MDTTGAASRFETLLYVKKGSTAYVTLNRPKVMNALNHKAIAELTEVFTDLPVSARSYSRIGSAIKEVME
jgi:enoyl-CoA hydratase